VLFVFRVRKEPRKILALGFGEYGYICSVKRENVGYDGLGSSKVRVGYLQEIPVINLP